MAALFALTFATIFTTSTASCLHSRDILPRQFTPARFGFTALQGPLNWFGLDQSANVLCARGRNQSPINVEPGAANIRTLGAGSRPSPNYAVVQQAKFINLGTTVEVELGSGTLTYDGTSYTLKQFHFHVPSEHRLREEHYPMEVHFVHQRTGKHASQG